MDNAKTKIAIVSYSLGGGGAERFAGTLSFMLEALGYEVHHVLVNHQVDYPYSGTLFSLEKQSQSSNGWQKKVKKGLLLHQYLKENQIEIIVDNRTRNHFWRELMCGFIYGHRTVYFMVHSFFLNNYFPESIFFSRWLYRRATRLICVSKAIESQVFQKYKFKNTVAIYNPVQQLDRSERALILPEKFLLYFGRIDKNKNLPLLVEAYKESQVSALGYQLIILGDGPDHNIISDLIVKKGLTDSIQMHPFTKHPSAYIGRAQFTVLTSMYEGFPMSIIESLSLGVPVISVDCPSGPNEVIIDQYNGLLVKNYDVSALGQAIKRMATDKALFNHCCSNASESVAHLSVEKIAQQWKNLLLG